MNAHPTGNCRVSFESQCGMQSIPPRPTLPHGVSSEKETVQWTGSAANGRSPKRVPHPPSGQALPNLVCLFSC
ncbi:hypothetical protein SAMN06265373_102424 [Shimia sagamensis]|uniref:Uncharacterized protein n=1 Tax=Shimia sagamensis TaxID=1566352 RepID=A0ABY1NMP1_9RHOB|nr:hypothetical protein SAMN06265373_102424 [Shimia sagamensis]